MLRVGARTVDDIDDLRHIIHGAEVDLVQTEAGRLLGAMTHIASEDFALSVGSFSRGVRGRGVFSRDRAVLGIALSATGPISQWSYDCPIDGLVICPPGSDHESVYRHRTSLATISIAPGDLAAHFEHEGHLGDQEYWNKVRRILIDPSSAARIRMSFSKIVVSLTRKRSQGSLPAAEHVRRSVIEVIGAGLLRADDCEGEDAPLAATKAVRQVEEFMARVGPRAIHISELCSDLGVSRRTLHRAFSETLGIGPIAFLRKSRLTSIYSVLKRSDPATVSVGDVATEYGFSELGRFSAYYRLMFGEYPTETLRQANRGPVVQGARLASHD